MDMQTIHKDLSSLKYGDIKELIHELRIFNISNAISLAVSLENTILNLMNAIHYQHSHEWKDKK